VTAAPLVGASRAEGLLADALAESTADALEVCVAARTSSVLRFAGGRIHQPQDLSALQIMVRAVVDGRSARVAVSSPTLLADAVTRACTTAAALASSSATGGGTTDRPVPHRPAGPDADRPGDARSGLWSDATASWDADRRAGAVAALHRAAGRTGLAGTLAAGTTELAVATSRGLHRYAVATEASLSLTAIDDDGTSHAEELDRDAASLDPLATGAALIDEARRMRGAGELAPGRYDVVFGPAATAELVGFLPAFGFTAPALAAGIGVVAAGTRTLSPLVTVADDATGGPGLPWPFDIEGVTKARVDLVRCGRPVGVVSDLASAAVTGGSTGHAHIAREEAPAPRAANLRVEVGTAPTAALIAGVERGVYIQRLWYTRLVDATSGVITGTTRDAAFEIRDGRLARPVAGMAFTESVLDALERLDGVGDRSTSQPVLNVWNGATSAPAVRIRGFRLGAGRQATP
jgi:PmbA protein